ncbi:MAG TPA: molybdenum cofactor guanylyltransferase [Blastocatellia bacterium]|nr:molybdenum cofactor guanylyltransferase [Blastocatellia bacterium]
MRVTGFVTAGGLSSRMGRDKAWLPIGGRPMIERAIDALRAVSESVSIIANGDEYLKLGLPVIRDKNPGLGPIEAVRTALAHSKTSHAVLLGCDLPFVSAGLLSFIIGLSDPNDGYEAVVPVGRDSRLEPLCAVYSTSALAPIEEMIERGDRKVRLLFGRVRTRFVPFEEIEHLPGSALFFENVNTPEEYGKALGLAPPAKNVLR